MPLPLRPRRVDSDGCRRQGATTTPLGGRDDQQLVGPRGTPGARTPQAGELACRVDAVAADTRQSIACWCCRSFPGGGRQVHRSAEPTTTVGLDIADDDDHDRIVGKDRPDIVEHLTQ